MRALVIGLGVGEQHVQCYRDAGLDVVTCDRSGRDIAGIESVDNWRLALNDVDIVSVCSHDEDHFEQASTALDAGKWVMVEKPPCLHHDEALYLMDRDAKLACNLPLSFHFKDLIEEYKQKDFYLMECDYLWGRHHKLVDGWRADSNYSIILGAGLHLFELMLHFKSDMPCDGSAMGANKSGAKVPYDCVQTLIRWTDGTLGKASINCAFNGQHQHRIALYTRDEEKVVINTESVDKQAPIRAFLDNVMANREMNNDRLWRAMDLCFQLEQVA